MSVDVYYLSTNKFTATLTKSSDSSAQTGATVTLTAYAYGSSGTLTLSAVSMSDQSDGTYTYIPASTVFSEGRYVAEVTATVAASTYKRFAKVPVRVLSDPD